MSSTDSAPVLKPKKAKPNKKTDRNWVAPIIVTTILIAGFVAFLYFSDTWNSSVPEESLVEREIDSLFQAMSANRTVILDTIQEFRKDVKQDMAKMESKMDSGFANLKAQIAANCDRKNITYKEIPPRSQLRRSSPVVATNRTAISQSASSARQTVVSNQNNLVTREEYQSGSVATNNRLSRLEIGQHNLDSVLNSFRQSNIVRSGRDTRNTVSPGDSLQTNKSHPFI